MIFKTAIIKGHGRGRGLGFPTINMFVSDTVPSTLVPGVYAAKVKLQDEKYKGALYYGPVPVFGETDRVFEVYLLDIYDINVRDGEPIEFETVKFIRGVMDFSSPELLVLQIEKDVAQIRKVLTMKV
jgi:riboflavin kinase/FMN adenylyltransferase